MRTYTKPPHWFKLLDLATFGSLPVISAAVTIWAHVAEATGPKGWQALMWVVTAVMLGIYIRVVLLRRSFLKRFTFFGGKYGIMVEAGEYKTVIEQNMISAETDRTIEGWKKIFSNAEEIARKDYLWVWFEPGPITRDRGSKVKVNGYTIARGRDMIVGYRAEDQPLERTAYAHELGHVIQGHATGDWTESTHHKRSKDNKLP